MNAALPVTESTPTGADRSADRTAPPAERPAVRTCLEWGERLVILALYGWLVARLWAGIWEAGQYVNLLLLASEGLVIILVLIRRSAVAVSPHPGDWLLALSATSLPLAVVPGGQPIAPVAVAAGFLLTGMIVQVHAKLTLGRSFGLLPANRGLKVAGPYRFVRHPMYAGYMLTHVGYLAANPSWWNLAVYALANGLQVVRLLAEERLLTRDERYQVYRTAVRYRLIPAVF